MSKFSANVKVNYSTSSIEMTNTFSKKASKYGSEEFNFLKEIRDEFPTFKIVVKEPRKVKNPSIKGLTYEYMEAYLKKYNPQLLKNFKALTTKADDNDVVASYVEVKKWFLYNCEEFERNCKQNKDKRLANENKIRQLLGVVA